MINLLEVWFNLIICQRKWHNSGRNQRDCFQKLAKFTNRLRNNQNPTKTMTRAPNRFLKMKMNLINNHHLQYRLSHKTMRLGRCNFEKGEAQRWMNSCAERNKRNKMSFGKVRAYNILEISTTAIRMEKITWRAAKVETNSTVILIKLKASMKKTKGKINRKLLMRTS